MKKSIFKILLLSLTIIFCFNLCGAVLEFAFEEKEYFLSAEITETEVDKIESDYNMRSLNGQHFRVIKSEILYTLEDKAGYLLLEFSPSGYAVVERVSGNFFEYSFEDISPYGNEGIRKYYLGQLNYFEKVSGDNFKHTYYRDNTYKKSNLQGVEEGVKNIRKTMRTKTQSEIIQSENSTNNSNDNTYPYNPSDFAIKIRNSEIIEEMKYFGNNVNGSCGMVSMGIVLQYYNQIDACYKNQYIQNIYNYELASSESQKLRRAEDLHKYIISITPHESNSYATNLSMQQKGLNNYLQAQGLSPQITALRDYIVDPVGESKKLINEGKPLMMGIMYFWDLEDRYHGYSEAHSVVAYGYRETNGKLEYLCHFGWYPGSTRYAAVWLSKYGRMGYSYLDAPTMHSFTYSLVSTLDSVNPGISAAVFDPLKSNPTHFAQCTTCKYWKDEAHTFTYVTIKVGNKYTITYTCVYCRFSYSETSTGGIGLPIG